MNIIGSRTFLNRRENDILWYYKYGALDNTD